MSETGKKPCWMGPFKLIKELHAALAENLDAAHRLKDTIESNGFQIRADREMANIERRARAR